MSPVWRAVASIGLVLLILAPGGCASVAPVVKIGLVGPFEGRHRAIGYDALYSARLAVREINAAGGVGGYRVALVALDDRGNSELAAAAAASLVADQGVVAVVGHFLPAITEEVRGVYERGQLSLLAVGLPPFGESPPESLPGAFREAYAAVTPFDEEAGPFAGPTYDAFGLLRLALAEAEETNGRITRQAVQEALRGLEYEGMTGTVP